MHFENIIYLPGELKGRLAGFWILRKELMPMVTYGDLFEFVIMLCAVITLVLAIINAKK